MHITLFHLYPSNAIVHTITRMLPIKQLFSKCYSTSPALKSKSVFAAVPLGPPDAILGITEAFKADPAAEKINLGVGAYRNEAGKPYVLKCVQKAEESLNEKYKDKEYTGIAGLPEFTKVSAELAYGAANPILSDKRVAISQSISGTGALRIGGEFLSRFHPGCRKILLPTPTWGNHTPIFKDSRLEVGSYRYFNPKTNGLDLEGMIQDLKAAPEGSIVLLHACAHNPTGVDPTSEQWSQISQICRQRGLFPFFDMAYQGFASGNPERDAQAVRSFVKDGHSILLAQSYAKNFGLYGERVGAISAVCASPEEAQAVASQMKIIIRPMYSNPPIHGARIVSTILQSPDLTKLWSQEVDHMAQRIISMRTKLRSLLETKHRSSLPWSHITNQIGMFCFTGLKPDQVAKLTNDHHIYLTKDGRISIAGITEDNVEHLADSIHKVTK